MGLLSKANLFETEAVSAQRLAFSTLIKKNNIQSVALLTETNGFYQIINSFNFDISCIINSYSSIDFWNGIITQSNKPFVLTKQDNSINSLYQIFSLDLIDILNKVTVIRNSNNNILILCNSEITDQIINDFSNLDINYSEQITYSNFDNSKNYYKYQVHFDDINFYENYSEERKKLIFTAILNECLNRINFLYINDNLSCIYNSKTIRIIFSNSNSLNSNLFINHLKLNLGDILKEKARNLYIEYSGKCDTAGDLSDFLKAE